MQVVELRKGTQIVEGPEKTEGRKEGGREGEREASRKPDSEVFLTWSQPMRVWFIPLVKAEKS